MIISPWNGGVLLTSPNGELHAQINNAGEIAMGAPTSGTLYISNGIYLENCNPSMVWSGDSEYLAVPQWTRRRNQRLLIVSLSKHTSRYAPGEYRVLQLESFENGFVRGVDSPIHKPRRVEFDVSELKWETGI